MSDDLSIPSPTYRQHRQRAGMEPGTKRLMIIAAGLGGTLLVVVGGWSVLGHRNSTVPVVQADDRPVRVKPDNPGGLQVAGANDDFLSGSTDTSTGKLAPPPEAPAPQALRAPPPQPQTPPAPPAAPAAPVVAPAVVPTPAKPPAKLPSVVEKHPAAPENAAPVGAKGVLIQLAAVRSEEAARSEWQRLSKRMPDLLAQHKLTLSKTERDGQALWRVRTGGFSDAAQAAQFCERVRAKGAGCAVAEF